MNRTCQFFGKPQNESNGPQALLVGGWKKPAKKRVLHDRILGRARGGFMILFQDLDGKRVGVAVPLEGEPVCLYGLARLESDATLGSMLRITVSDPAGSFDILLKETEWSGTIEQRVADENCDYFVQLAARKK